MRQLLDISVAWMKVWCCGLVSVQTTKKKRETEIFREEIIQIHVI